MKRTVVMLSRKQMKSEQKLREQVKIKRMDFLKRRTILEFHNEDVIDGESFQDPEGKGWRKTTISLNGPQKYISLFDCDRGLRLYLTNKEAKELQRKGFLYLIEQDRPGADSCAAEASEKSKEPVLLN